MSGASLPRIRRAAMPCSHVGSQFGNQVDSQCGKDRIWISGVPVAAVAAIMRCSACPRSDVASRTSSATVWPARACAVASSTQ